MTTCIIKDFIDRWANELWNWISVWLGRLPPKHPWYYEPNLHTCIRRNEKNKKPKTNTRCIWSDMMMTFHFDGRKSRRHHLPSIYKFISRTNHMYSLSLSLSIFLHMNIWFVLGRFDGWQLEENGSVQIGSKAIICYKKWSTAIEDQFDDQVF